MIDFIKELEVILKTDPLGLLNVKPRASSTISPDERLFASFEEINEFIRENDREPAKSRDINERKLYSRLKGLRDNSEKVALLIEHDVYKLFDGVEMPEPKEINTIVDVIEDDPLGLLSDDKADNDIFNLKNIPRSIDRPDYIAKRKPCKEFDQFEPLFKEVHADLVSKKKETKPFTSELQIKPGKFFVLQGMLVYVANVGKKEVKNFGNVNARLYCVFENGTESNILLRSFAAALWKDENSRRIMKADQPEIFGESEPVSSDDKATGYIYVLRSLSEDPEIKSIKNLYKIGFSTQPTKQRVQNATQEPTYLMADVEIVSEFQTYNLKPQKFEFLLHKFFGKSCLNLDVFDNEGKRHTPREWFVVPKHVIEIAINLLVSGEIVNYRYNDERQEIEEK